MIRNLKLYINDILDNMRLAQEMTRAIEFQQFVSEKPRHYTVIRCIEIIGEADRWNDKKEMKFTQ
jgi:uncharacterized protein with HEPN domain